MYKTEPIVAGGGEVILHAPQLREIGYHVRDYFVKQWDKLENVPWGALAHSTHLRGLDTCENGVEQARIHITLAAGIPEQVCRAVNLGYCDPAHIGVGEWQARQDEIGWSYRMRARNCIVCVIQFRQ